MVRVRTSPASVAHASKNSVADRRSPPGMRSIVALRRLGLVRTKMLTLKLCGAANPGCSRLSAGSLRLATGRLLPQETLPDGSSVAHVNAVISAAVPKVVPAVISALVSPLLLTIFTLASTAFAQRPQLGQLDASPTLFTVMAAVNAMGYDAQIDSTNNHPLRKAVRDELA